MKASSAAPNARTPAARTESGWLNPVRSEVGILSVVPTVMDGVLVAVGAELGAAGGVVPTWAVAGLADTTIQIATTSPPRSLMPEIVPSGHRFRPLIYLRTSTFHRTCAASGPCMATEPRSGLGRFPNTRSASQSSAWWHTTGLRQRPRRGRSRKWAGGPQVLKPAGRHDHWTVGHLPVST
ncbi:hypothetical protein DFR71_6242 [Nocardia alba]|uniref:Uncharacterized protein n=1 Tax=Nocardia alba TaxID=225051 RepID=A0A4R1FAW7_9NOCA|nr:hypothetical protein DFR71_6242 [Nocardia alba]